MTYAQTVKDPTAVMGRRIGAYLIDGLIGLVLVFVVLGSLLSSQADTTTFTTAAEAEDRCQLVNDATLGTGTDTDTDTTTSTGFEERDRYCIPAGDTTYEFTGEDLGSIMATLFVVSLLSGSLNTIVLQGLTGASIGKFLTGLRVVREDGRRVGFGGNLLRQVLFIVDGLCGVVGLIVAFTSKGHRRVGDMAASTYVVRKADSGSPIRVPGVTHQAAWPGQSLGAWPQGGTGGAGQGPDGWAAPPTSGPAGTWAPSGATDQLAPSAERPTWDPSRDAYIQYDHDQSAWLQWSDDARSWRPIDQ